MDLQPKWLVVVEMVIAYVLAIVTILRIVMQRREPTATLAWVLWIMMVPFLGVLLYILVGRRRLNRQIRRRKARSAALSPRAEELAQNVSELAVDEAPRHFSKPAESELVIISNRMGSRPPTCGNRATLLASVDRTYDELAEAIAGAKDHVHLLYYIFQPDDTGRRFRALLAERARAGVEVRVLTDGVGSFGVDEFLLPLEQAGGRHAEFLPVGRISKHWHPNLRNHRKIAIIDGLVGFTGGVNIGDEYTGRKKKVGPWRDTHLRIEGPALHHLQEVFIEDWYFATGEDLLDPRYQPERTAVGDQVVQIVASGPDTATEPIQRIFFTAITRAQRRVFLTTPYFVPDQAMRVALETAALRGVDVRLLLPERSDMPLVLYAGRSYYDGLLSSGVRIYEYRGGILHAKSLLVDDRWATVGSANMDVRSFRLNFEVNAMIYGEEFAGQLAEVFERDLAQARRIRADSQRKKGIKSRVLESTARVLSPVL